MRFFKSALAVVCLISILVPGAAVPCWADSGPASPLAVPLRLRLVPEAIKLDLSTLRKDPQPQGAAPAPARLAMPGPVHYQAGGGWSGLSTAKKTWIIVGIVVGAGAIVVLATNGGDDDGGGGGY